MITIPTIRFVNEDKSKKPSYLICFYVSKGLKDHNASMGNITRKVNTQQVR
jgi:hypothetical protein